MHTNDADVFFDLDEMVRAAPAEMPDDIFATLVDHWTNAAEHVVREPALHESAVVVKLQVLARVIAEKCGAGKHEAKIARQIARDVERLAKAVDGGYR
jgi:hypothetical protein